VDGELESVFLAVVIHGELNLLDPLEVVKVAVGSELAEGW
jgi:hypothetical protein